MRFLSADCKEGAAGVYQGDEADQRTIAVTDDDFLATLAGSAGVMSAELIPGGVGPGATFVITVTPDATNRFLSFATSLASSNDAFLAPWPGGIALANDDGTARTNANIEKDLQALLVTWDAGTEQNEVPGVGNNTQSEQGLPDLGTVDSDVAASEIGTKYSETNGFVGPPVT